MRLTWAPLAVADRESIFDYIARDNVEAAAVLDELFQRKAALLAQHPQAGRTGRMPSTRELVAHRHYLLVDDGRPDRIRILRVLHTALQWPPIHSRPRARRKKVP